MKRIGIIAALAGELKPLVVGWKTTDFDGGACYRHTGHGVETIAVHVGMGREAAARACMQAMEGGPLAALVSIGWAGALSSTVHTAQSYCVTDVVDASTGERYETEDHGRASGTTLVTARRVILKQEKRQYAEDFSAMLVDMEAATVARLARVRGIPFYCYKSVSDSVDDLLPDMNPFISSKGQMDMRRFVASVLVRPKYWPGLVRMGKNSSRGAVELARSVGKLQSEMSDGDGS